MERVKGTALVLGIIGLLLGGLIGFIVGASENSVTTTTLTNTEVSDDSSDVQVDFNNALRDHVSLTAAALRAAAVKDKNTEPLLKTLDANSIELAQLIGTAYGEAANATFLDLWRQHIDYFAEYTTGAVSGEQDIKKQALKNLDTFVESSSTFFSGANPDLSTERFSSLLAGHSDHIIKIIDAFAGGKVDQSYSLEQEARDHGSELADTLANAIVSQFPEKF